MQRLSILIILLLTVTFANQVVTFDNNWGEHPLFNVISESPRGMEVVFSVHEMVVEDMDVEGVPMQNYGVPGIFLFNNEGAPNLPSTGRYLAIPQGAQAQVTILDSRTEVYHGIEILPAPDIPRGDDDSPLRYVKDMTIYDRNAYYPEDPVVLSPPEKLRGVDVVTLGIAPFQYNPVTKELLVYKDLRIRIDFVGGNGHFGEDRLRSRYWEPILQNHIINYNSLPQIDFYSPEHVRSRDGWEYIIIVPDDPIFEAWGDTIKHWRKLQGISCEVFTLTDIGGSSASAIENFINNAYNTWNPAPVAFLILSDYPSSGRDYGVTSPIWNAYCASDNIYADVNNDNLPDMHHARICAQNEGQLSIMINKFLGYERNPYTASNFYDEPLVACGWQTTRWFQVCIETIRGFMINGLGKNPARVYAIAEGTPIVNGPWSTAPNTSTVVNYFYNLGYLPSTTNPYDTTWWSGGSAAGINAAINSGAFLVQHRDHGYAGGSGWATPHYTTSELNGLSNDKFTFVYSTNCATGQYTLPSECFTEKFHRMEHGALGVNSPSETSYSFVNDTYVWGMYDALWPQFMPGYPLMGPQLLVGHTNLLPCMAMTSGKYFLQQSSWPYNTGDKTVTYHLFHHHGDAFNVFYSEMPTMLTVIHEPRIIAGATSFQVTANDSSIIALTVDGEIIGVAEGTGSPVNISITPQTVGAMVKVTVTKFNHYRYDVDIPVVPSNYGHVTIASIILGGLGGNGQINPGETISYGVYAKNMGTQTLQSVYGLMSTADPYISMTTDSSWYGSIAELDSSCSTPDYVFNVAHNCPNAHVATLELEFHDNNDSTWIYNPEITIYAPILIYQGVVVVGGTWDNGILDPSETAGLVVTIMNEGGMDAENVNTTLNTSSSEITILDNASNFGTVEVGNTASNASDPFMVYANATIPFGTSVDFSLCVQAGVYVDTLDFSLFVGQSVPTDTGYYYAYYSGGPYAEAPVFDWVAIDSTQSANPGVSLDIATNQTVVVSLPFTFRYYGVEYDRISICSHGWVAMDSTNSTDPSNTAIPNVDGPPGMIAGIWDFLQPGIVGQPADIYYFHDATNHRFIIEYFRIGHLPTGLNPETFEIILYDPVYYPTPTGDGEIVVQYLTALQLEGASTLGIENYSQTVGVEYCFNNSYDSLAVPITDSFALRYTTAQPTVGIEEYQELVNVPLKTMMHVIYPNPFTRHMSISYQLASRGRVSLKVYDATGRLVAPLVEGSMDPGYYRANWDGCDPNGRRVPAGVYFIKLITDDYQNVQKTVLLK
jgi:hypothetical protein